MMDEASRIIGDAVKKAIGSAVAKSAKTETTTSIGTYEGTDDQGKDVVLIAGAEEPTPVRRMSVQAEVGDTVTVTVGNGIAVVDSNVSNPSASASNVERVDGKATVAQETAVEAIDYAVQASTAASNAQASADAAGYAARNAQASADSAQADATRANAAANAAVADAATARTAAESAQEDAETAMTAAQKATYGLSDVEKVVGTLNWIAEHGEYVLTTDTVVDASKVYYTRSGTSPDYAYTVVADPKDSELPTYYELDLDESVQQYIAAHLWLDNYGLNLSVDSANGYRIHQGTVDGTKTAGMYVLDALGEIVAQFGASGAVVGKADGTHVVIDADSMDIVDGNLDVVSTFTANGVTIGKSDETKATVNSGRFEIEDPGGRTVFALRCHNGSDGLLVIRTTYTGDGSETEFAATRNPVSVVSCGYVDESYGTLDAPTISGGKFVFANPPLSTSFFIRYETDEIIYHATIGTRATNSVGMNSVAIGTGNTATGADSMAIGYASSATHYASLLLGRGLISASNGQVVLGRYNDPNDGLATTARLVIGGGTNEDTRSNLLSVDGQGNVTFYGDIFNSNDTVLTGGRLFGTTASFSSDVTVRGNLVGVGGTVTVDGGLRASGNVVIKNTGVDTSAADNGVTANKYNVYSMRDENDRYYAFVQSVAASDGATQIQVAARNFGTGANVDNILYLTVENDGTRKVAVSNQTAWRNGLGVLGCKNANNYDGMMAMNGSDSAWIRTTTAGLIPYARDGGSSSLGTSSWPFNNVYAENIYLNGTALGTLATKSSLAAGDIPNISAAKLTSGTLPVARLTNNAWAYLVGSASANFYVRWCKVANIVHVEASGLKSLSSGANTKLATVPSGSRPSKEVSNAMYMATNNMGCFWVQTDGSVYAKSYTGAASGLYCFISYPVI